MDPNATLRRLRELLGGDHSASPPTTVEEALADCTKELENLICEAETLFQGLDTWLGQKQGFRPHAWNHQQPVLVPVLRGLLQDIDEVLWRCGEDAEQWWDDTVTAGLAHRWAAEDFVGQERSTGIVNDEEPGT